MSKEEVIQEIEDEIKKAKGDPEEFEIQLTDDPVEESKEEAKDVAEEKLKKTKMKLKNMEKKFKSE